MSSQQGAGDGPLDAADPRYTRTPQPSDSTRRLVPGRGPRLPDPDDPRIRILRIAVPGLVVAAVAVVIAVFSAALSPGRQSQVVGPRSAVVAAIAERPQRVCFNDSNPCAWLTVVDGRLVAFNTSGPLPQEYGRAGVGWCASSGWFGANSTGSRFDQEGRWAQGPAPRGLDRFALVIDDDGNVVVDFTQLTAGRQRHQVDEVTPPAGPHCETIPFDRDADLRLPDLPSPVGGG